MEGGNGTRTEHKKEGKKSDERAEGGGEGRTRREFTITKKERERERARETQERKPQEKEKRRWRGLKSLAISPTLCANISREKTDRKRAAGAKKINKKSNFAPQARKK